VVDAGGRHVIAQDVVLLMFVERRRASVAVVTGWFNEPSDEQRKEGTMGALSYGSRARLLFRIGSKEQGIHGSSGMLHGPTITTVRLRQALPLLQNTLRFTARNRDKGRPCSFLQ
jgi:hypothetical protein